MGSTKFDRLFSLLGNFETYKCFDTHQHRSKVDEMRSFINQLPERYDVIYNK